MDSGRHAPKKERAADGFLRAYADCGTVRGAARLVGISKQAVSNWRATDPAFALALEEIRASCEPAGRKDLTPAEVERKHVLVYPDDCRRNWVRRQMARWLSVAED